VGKHTGFAPTATIWPLTLAVFWETCAGVNGDTQFLMQRFLIEFSLWCSNKQLDHISRFWYVPSLAVDAVQAILELSATNISNYCTEGCLDLSLRYESVHRLNSDRLYKVSQEVYSYLTSQFVLPSNTTSEKLSAGFIYPRLTDPLSIKLSFVSSVSKPPSFSTSGSIVEGDACTEFYSYVEMQNAHYFKLSGRLFDVIDADDDSGEQEFNIEELYENLKKYQQRCSTYDAFGTAGGESVLLPEIYSTRLLVVWIGYCWCHKIMCLRYPFLCKFEVSLKVVHLGALTISNAAAILALTHTAEYIRMNRRSPGGSASREYISRGPIFTRHADDETGEMVSEFCMLDKYPYAMELQQRWKRYCDVVRRCSSKRWTEILTKRERLQYVVAEMQRVSDELQQLEDHLSSVFDHRRDEFAPVKRKCSELRRELSSLGKEEAVSQRLPPDINFPLPSPANAKMGLYILFFLYITSDFETLYKFSFCAQQQIVPASMSQLDSTKAVIQETFDDSTSLIEVFKQRAESTGWTERTPSGTFLRSKSKIQVIRCRLTVEHVNENDGISYLPDSIVPVMSWSGDGLICSKLVSEPSNYFINPFAFDRQYELVGKGLSYSLDKSSLRDDLFIPYLGAVSGERGNTAIARQNSAPDWLSKEQYIRVAALRASPFRQWIKLGAALQGANVPLDREEVHTLIRQCLYHYGSVGYYETEKKIMRYWVRSNNKPYLMLLVHELSRKFEELRDKPRAYRSLRILIELSTYICQFLHSSRDLCRRYCRLVMAWAAEIDERIVNKDIDNSIQHMRRQQCIFYMYGILCHRYGVLTEEDVTAIFVCNALVSKYSEGVVTDEVSSLREHCVAILSRRLTNREIILKSFEPLAQMCAAVGLTNLMERSGLTGGLTWRPVVRGEVTLTGLYEVILNSQCTLVLNCLSGVILVNGRPIQGLEVAISNHPLFRRVFGDTRFEVVTINGISTSTNSGNRLTYTFQYDAACNRVLIKEHHTEDSNTVVLELLMTGGSDGSYHGMPRILRDNYSHWICREEHFLLLRPLSFENQEIEYFGTFDSTSGKITLWECPQHRVWMFSHKDQLKRIVEKRNEYFLRKLDEHAGSSGTGASILSTLSKFEDVEYIHAFCNVETGLFKYDFPRFALTFECKRPNTIVTTDCSLTALGLSAQQNLPSPFTVECHQLHRYTLCSSQQLHDIFYGFTSYLLLQNGDSCKVLVPDGEIRRCNISKRIYVAADTLNSLSNRSFHIFDLHPRFRFLSATTLSSRLFLAALYAATGTRLNEASLNMTGAEYACSVVRGCWTNRPLMTEEMRNTDQLRKFTVQCPTLRLLVDELHLSSNEVRFLNLLEQDDELRSVDNDAVTAYQSKKLQSRYRQSCTPAESNRIFGSHDTMTPLLARPADCRQFERQIDHHRFDENIVSFTEISLQSFVESSYQGFGTTGFSPEAAFPLREANASCKISQHILLQLRQSYASHTMLPTYEQSMRNPMERETIDEIAGMITEYRAEVESYILFFIDSIHDDDVYMSSSFGPRTSINCNNIEAFRFRLRRTANKEATVGVLDLLKIAHNPRLVHVFNPFLPDICVDHIRDIILLWLQLCVLEDKLARLMRLHASGDTNAWVNELRWNRIWPVKQYPEWLVFEAENNLQIRPLQYSVAQSMVQTPNQFVQLNMGEGKSKVIVPMLLLYWTRCKPTASIIRLNCMSQLLDVDYEDLHARLTASSFNLRLLTLPFNRDVQLDAARLTVMGDQLVMCQQFNGCLVLSPEHRMSLKLKRHELKSWALIKIYDEVICVGKTFTDIFDESDELLRHSNQLVYAVGSQSQLPGKNRWLIAQCLLKLLWDDPALLAFMERPMSPITVVAEMYKTGVTDRKCYRFLPAFKSPSNLSEFRKLLFNRFLSSAEGLPVELGWLLNPEYRSVIDAAQDYILHADRALAPISIEDETMKDDILALRGFIAFDLLVTCLSKKFRVEYGINRATSKKIAVPYRACDTPSERSEYSHPDMAIVLTVTAYYRDGLTRKQLFEMLELLLAGSISQQTAYYNAMYKLSEPLMSELDRPRLNCASKIDLANVTQFGLLYKYFSHNTEAICLWLNSFVFPKEMKVFSEKLIASAWDVARTDNAVGFSGTDDNELLLPTNLRMNRIDNCDLKATKGKMIDLVQRNLIYHSIDGRTSETVLSIIELATEIKSGALIDCGGMMAGYTNRQVAQMWLQSSAEDICKYVAFYDGEMKGGRGWRIRSSRGQEWQLKSSPIQVWECFVIFDESRCRGTDFKLSTGCKGLVTLGKHICKDKLLQAVGRLRQLADGQTVEFVGTADVTVNISTVCNVSVNDITSKEILEWAVHNTVTAVREGMLSWALQGLAYYRRHAMLKLMEPETILLRELYGAPLTQSSVKSIFQKAMNMLPSPSKGSNNDIFLQRLTYHMDSFVDPQYCSAVAVDEECEREIESEKQREQEAEKQLPVMEPYCETDWPYEICHEDSNFDIVLLASKAVPINTFFAKHFNKSYSSLQARIRWEDSNILVTNNFIMTIKTSTAAIDEYFRPIDGFLYDTSSRRILLLSDREADQLHFRTKVGTLAYTGCSADPEQTMTSVPASIATSLADCSQLVLMKLFNGCTAYETDLQKQCLKQILSAHGAKEAAYLFPKLRGLHFMVERSDLDVICRTQCS
jgi:hypothetical protein